MKQTTSLDFRSAFGSNSHAVQSGSLPFCVHRVNSPLGAMIAIGDDVGLYFLGFDDQRHVDLDILMLQKSTQRPLQLGKSQLLTRLEEEIEAYFAGKCTEFKTPLVMRGTPFQNEVWTDLKGVPYGKTLSYLEQARRLQRDRSYRAVANANGRNPFIIIVPCHRIIASDGSLGGYGAGLERKKQLLNLEQRGRLDLF